MFTICKRTLDAQGDVSDTALARCRFKQRDDAVCYLNKITQLLWPDAGYEGEQGYWWVRDKGVVTRYAIRP